MLTKRPIHQTAGATALWDWMERRGLNQREAAKVLELHFMSLNQYLHGHRRPGLAAALRIERHTGLPAGIWMRTPVSEKKRRKSGATVNADKQMAYGYAR
jgi:transcriptional regulator with XRE-family HTH domain